MVNVVNVVNDPCMVFVVAYRSSPDQPWSPWSVSEADYASRQVHHLEGQGCEVLCIWFRTTLPRSEWYYAKFADYLNSGGQVEDMTPWK